MITWKQKSFAHRAFQLDHINDKNGSFNNASLQNNYSFKFVVEIYHGNLGSERTPFQNQKLDIGFPGSQWSHGNVFIKVQTYW